MQSDEACDGKLADAMRSFMTDTVTYSRNVVIQSIRREHVIYYRLLMGRYKIKSTYRFNYGGVSETVTRHLDGFSDVLFRDYHTLYLHCGSIVLDCLRTVYAF